MADSKTDYFCINTLRMLAIDAIQKANSGHPGLPLGASPMAYVLFDRHLRFDPQTPDWADRDRFVLSAGHGSMLLYSLLHMYGYDLSLDDLKDFRQWGSKTPGHPEYFLTAGVEATTGPLGQGASNTVGMAIAERKLANYFNRPGEEIVDHFTYALLGDGDVMEGISGEAASLAGHLGLGKLIHLYDANDICLDGPISDTFTEDVGKRYESYGWQVLRVEEGDTDLDGIDKAIADAKADTARPSLIIVKTTIGYGSPNKAGSSASHGSPLGPDEVRLTKEAFGWPPDLDFEIPDPARAHFASSAEHKRENRKSWDEGFARWSLKNPELAEEWDAAMKGELPQGWDAELPTWPAGESLATRAAGGKVLNAIATTVPWFFGGDADLSCSTKTAIADGGSFAGDTGAGRNIHYGVREHAMGAIANGIAYHGGLRTYTATFFTFSDYMRPAMRLAALNGLPVTFVFTHDSIGLGEDGPTHQAVEQLMSLRCMPELHMVRPADPNETTEAWRYAMKRTDGPTALVLSRQGLPSISETPEGLHKGAYVLWEPSSAPKAILLATGSEVALALEAAKALSEDGVPTRVVSMPCWRVFDAQDAGYRDSVLPRAITARVAVEAGVGLGWERYIGMDGQMVTVEKFGHSAPAGIVFEKYGFTVDAIKEKVRGQL